MTGNEAAKQSVTRPDWDEIWMNVALELSRRSTCLSRKVGAVIIGEDNQVIAWGYNGALRGEPHCTKCAREGIPPGQRLDLCRGIHAEQNAIDVAARHGISTLGATLYLTHYPCTYCAKSIIQAGITALVFRDDYPNPLAKEVLRALTQRCISHGEEKVCDLP